MFTIAHSKTDILADVNCLRVVSSLQHVYASEGLTAFADKLRGFEPEHVTKIFSSFMIFKGHGHKTSQIQALRSYLELPHISRKEKPSDDELHATMIAASNAILCNPALQDLPPSPELPQYEEPAQTPQFAYPQTPQFVFPPMETFVFPPMRTLAEFASMQTFQPVYPVQIAPQQEVPAQLQFQYQQPMAFNFAPQQFLLPMQPMLPQQEVPAFFQPTGKLSPEMLTPFCGGGSTSPHMSVSYPGSALPSATRSGPYLICKTKNCSDSGCPRSHPNDPSHPNRAQ